ncbi:MAG: AAA family ATPase, partial [Clostridiales bacterium]|nr:AAA family ATPase [Clostridiales bacterium]
MYYHRHIEQVVLRIAKRKAVIVLTGARQVGKSTMLKEVFGGVNYIALNRPLVRESARENPSLFFDAYKPPVIVDEIQKAAELFDYIKDIVDTHKAKGQFYLTGSQSLSLMKNVGDSLAGRAGIIKMLGFSARELCGVKYRGAFIPARD